MPLSERSSFDDTWNEMDILTSSNDAGYSPASASQEEEGEGEGEKRTEVFKSDSFMEIDSLITGVSSRKDTLLEDGEGDASVPLEVQQEPGWETVYPSTSQVLTPQHLSFIGQGNCW